MTSHRGLRSGVARRRFKVDYSSKLPRQHRALTDAQVSRAWHAMTQVDERHAVGAMEFEELPRAGIQGSASIENFRISRVNVNEV
jgi:hypothetical protein